MWPSLVAAWAAAVIGWRRIDAPMQRLSGTLLAAGGGLLLVVWAVGVDPVPIRALALNMPVVALFVGISFLSLAGESLAASGSAAPRPASVWRTMVHVNLIGAVINLSMVTLVGDRIRRNGSLDRAQAVALVRSYCAAAFWSPFFVAAAVAATYAPGADPFVTVPLGLLAATTALWVTGREVQAFADGAFAGYRPDRTALVLSLGLVVAVLTVSALVPWMGVVVIVAAASPLFALVLMPRRGAAARLHRLLTQALPSSASQVILFLAAGVFAHGAAVALATFVDPGALAAVVLPPFGYAGFVALIVGGAYLGLHPIVTIAAIAGVVAPMDVDASLLAFAFLSGWAIGTAAAPLSGINLLIIGRYRISARDVVRWHPRYAATMWVIVSVIIAIAARFV